MVCSLVLKEAYRTFQQARSTLCVVHIFKHIHFSRVPLLNNPCTAATRPSPFYFLEHPHFVGVNNATYVQKRCISTDGCLRNRGDGSGKGRGQVSVSRSPGHGSGLSPAQKVKEAGKDFTYLIVVLVGIGVTGGLLYLVFKELFSSSSPSKIYGKALNKCRANPEVIGAFGEPIKGSEFLRDGVKYMRLKFYIEGAEPRLQGTVHTEMRENPTTGKYECRYIFVDVDTYPRRTIVVEDNR
ncbi:hypothetical protein AAFF_G00094410 [Aldrovandia affinis]|uniref:Mitochondrial import inner membrane translocase subunit Tim21 n=1 Tax=Aldrovandia affinis TaxID=143900 RepID=A0AAD7WY90_9TELE|nr:hypothetical protein AAFF_G00094410 [Aldrovandia affinis]